jgi:general secretion pathway protein D
MDDSTMNARPGTAPRRPRHFFVALAVTLPLLHPLTLQAQAIGGTGDITTIANPPGSPPPEEVTLNLKNADIQALISAVSDLTGKNFVVDPRVQATVTVISARPTSREALYEVFLSVLKVHGFTAVESGNVIKILPEATAKQEGGGDVYGALPRSGALDDLVTMVLTLRNTDAPSMIGAIQPFTSPTGHLTAHVAGNTLVISDTRVNVDRLVSIIDRIDQAISTEIEVVRLQYAAASDVASTLNTLRGGGAGQGAPGGATAGGQIVADDRSNSLLLGGPADQRLRMRAIISHLDTPIESIGPEVVYLRYAKASDLAPLLTSIATGNGTAGTAGSGAPPPLPVPGGGTAGAGGAGGNGGRLGGDIRIQADENTNALIIQAPPESLLGLKSIIRQLDIRRAQVYVEGVIAEVSDLTNRELGVQWQSDPSAPGTFSVGRFPVNEPNIVGLARDGAATAAGLTLGYLSTGNFQALIRILGTDSYNNLLSTPTLVTMDNEEAEILVGQNVPFVTGQFTNTGANQGQVSPFQTIERQDVGVKLKLTPQINEGDSILLTLEQEVSNVVPSTVATADITTNKRSIKTTVLVDDGQTLVIGGLTDDNLTENVSKVPVLGDLPLIGNVFRNKTAGTTKRSLMVFLRTSIIRDQRTGTQISANKYNYLRGLQLERRGDPVWPGFKRDDAPLLPSLENGLIELPQP